MTLEPRIRLLEKKVENITGLLTKLREWQQEIVDRREVEDRQAEIQRRKEKRRGTR